MENPLLIVSQEFFFAGTCLPSCSLATDIHVTILYIFSYSLMCYMYVCMYVCMYVEGVGQKCGPCTATFNDLLMCYKFVLCCIKSYFWGMDLDRRMEFARMRIIWMLTLEVYIFVHARTLYFNCLAAPLPWRCSETQIYNHVGVIPSIIFFCVFFSFLPL
jgi:hypothetical protein